ncbi:hypothetical protein GGS23DRAFT_529384 [Durotheca rogersii]|uniref:uncharacterized protein n=1 Tax=Durotheca rogersii TaxID=419775 RepID=UPI00221F995A|nr:uncharacterized protein GGS23DRAFT_529384 [Durotheca rogersii]KAI5863363.1 hypothetical protein GGS23DRAFT_529384 [Durotheca rogersii]
MEEAVEEVEQPAAASAASAGGRAAQRAIIISGWPCVGKSWLINRGAMEGYAILDLDSSRYSFLADGRRNPRFEEDYIAAILRRVGDEVILMVSAHRQVRQRLADLGLWFALVMPRRELREVWLQRMVSRGTADMVPFFRDNWDTLVAGCVAQQGCDIVYLGSAQYLENVILNIVTKFKPPAAY